LAFFFSGFVKRDRRLKGSRISELNFLATSSSLCTASGRTSTEPGSSVTEAGASGYAQTYTSPSGRG
jgi:hypothetical protein